jgi:hypothetical protein
MARVHPGLFHEYENNYNLIKKVIASILSLSYKTYISSSRRVSPEPITLALGD